PTQPTVPPPAGTAPAGVGPPRTGRSNAPVQAGSPRVRPLPARSGRACTRVRARGRRRRGRPGPHRPHRRPVSSQRPPRSPDGHRVPWSDIDQAQWSTSAMTFVEEGAGSHSIPLCSPESPDGAVDYRRLAETVSERVTSTILVNRYVPYPDESSDSGFRLVAR